MIAARKRTIVAAWRGLYGLKHGMPTVVRRVGRRVKGSAYDGAALSSAIFGMHLLQLCD
jgi:hypothetical protein